jgi:hypothetical protein
MNRIPYEGTINHYIETRTWLQVSRESSDPWKCNERRERIRSIHQDVSTVDHYSLAKGRHELYIRGHGQMKIRMMWPWPRAWRHWLVGEVGEVGGHGHDDERALNVRLHGALVSA